jgi:glycosidase
LKIIDPHAIRKSICRFRHLALCVGLFSLCACGASGGGAPTTASGQDNGSSLLVPDAGAVSMLAASSLPANWSQGAFMQIHVRAYQDSNGDGVGDLQGLIDRLDYLQDLGVKGLWLLPVTQSSDRDHGYAVTNYRGIELDYGAMADFEKLLTQAHLRGMGVVIDYVINHSSNQHPLFLNAASSSTHAQRDYFVWQNPAPAGWGIYGKNPWYPSSWGNGYYFAGFTASMPDFNWKQKDVENFHHDNMRFWLNKGVDGFRFDAVGNLVENGPSAWESQPENHTVMNKVRQTVMQYPQRFMVCEAPANPQAFAAATSCGAAFAFDLKDAITGAAQGDVNAIAKLNAYYKTSSPALSAFVSNHDSFAGKRLWDQVQGNIAQYKLAAASYLLMPGTPFIYYGEEIGMAAAANLSGDAALRTPMSWTADAKGFSTGTAFRAISGNVSSQNAATQIGVAGSIHSFYKSLLNLRNTLPSISRGSYEAAWTQQQSMGFQRVLGSEKTWVVFNYGLAPMQLSLNNLQAGDKWKALLGDVESFTVTANGNVSLAMPAQSVAVFQLNN